MKHRFVLPCGLKGRSGADELAMKPSEAFGVPEGTRGRAQMTQVGLWQRPSGKGATADHYPVEHIKLHVLPH